MELQDTHGGFKLALMNPEVVLYDEDEEGNPVPYTPKPTASQEYLWSLYLEHIREVKKLADGSPIVVIHDGDLAQGGKHKTLLVSDRMADQMRIGAWNLKPWLELKNLVAMRIAVGTEAHNFGMGSAEIMVQELLQAQYPKSDIKVCYHGLLTVGGVNIDFAHHGPHPGSRSWLKGNIVRFYLRDLMTREILAGNKPPDLVMRAHRHEYIHETLNCGKYFSRICLGPSYSMLGDYAVMATQSAHEITNGLVAWEIKDGRLREPYKFMKTRDVRTKEEL